MTWGWLRNVTLLAAGATAGYFFGRRLSVAGLEDEQRYLVRKRLLFDLNDGRAFTLWTEVPTISDAKPDDQVFVIDGVEGKIVFGDGIHGRRPPVDGGTLTAKYESRSQG